MTTRAEPIAYTVSAAARELDVSLPTVYGWLDDGTLTQAQTEGKPTMVTGQSVRDLKARRAKRA